MSRFYCVFEVASLLRVKPTSVYSWIKDGRLECVRVGRLIRITEEQLSQFLRADVMNTAAKRISPMAEAGI